MKFDLKSYVLGVLVEALVVAIFLYCKQPRKYTCECEKCDDWFTVVTSEELNEKQREFVRNFCACDKIERELK
mgnify:CR=1 FL=1